MYLGIIRKDTVSRITRLYDFSELPKQVLSLACGNSSDTVYGIKTDKLTLQRCSKRADLS